MNPVKSKALVVWAALLLAFPLIALLWGAEESGVFEYVPVIAIGAAFVFALSRAPGERVIAIAAITGLSALLYVTLFLMLAEPYQSEKLTQFVMVILIFGLMLGFAIQDRLFLDRLPVAFLIIGSIAIVLFALNPSAHQAGRLSIGEGNPIWMGRAVSLAGVAAIWFIIRREKTWAAWGVLLVSLAAISLTGSRGPLVSLVAAAAYGLLFLQRRGNAPTVAVAAYAVAVLVTLQLSYSIIPQLRAFGLDDAGRGQIYSYAVYLLTHNPEGIGIGNFRLGGFVYPHNLFLEFLLEWGWFLGSIPIFLICWGGYRLLRMPAEFDILKLAFISELLNSMASGDITSPRMLYALVFVGLCGQFAMGRIPRRARAMA